MSTRGAGSAFLIAAFMLLATGAIASEHDGTCLGGATEAEAAAIADWRAVTLSDGRVLRLAAIESFGLLHRDEEAAEAVLKRRLDEMLSGRTVRVRILGQKPDRHGRLPALIAATDGPLVQAVLVREGLAVVFATGDPIPCLDSLLAAEGEARNRRRGFWAHHRVPPALPAVLVNRIGRFAMFEGTLHSVGTRRARTYLNFGSWWSADVTVAIDARHRDRFGGEAELEKLSGRKLRVRGFLEERGGPMVTVSSPMQIEVLGEAAKVEGNTP